MTSMSRQSYLSDMLGSPGVLVIFSPCWQLIWINNLICFMLTKDDEISLVPLSCFPCPVIHKCLSFMITLSHTTLLLSLLSINPDQAWLLTS